MPFLPSHLTDGALLRPTDVAFISSTYAAHGGGTHTYTHIARTYNILQEGRKGSLLARRLKDIVVLGRRGFGI